MASGNPRSGWQLAELIDGFPFKTSPLAPLAVLALALLQAPPALAHDQPDKRTLSLSASGAVKTTPDKVDISTGVTSEAKTAREALDQNSDAMTKVVEALKAEGIDAKDIQTSNFSVNRVYDQRPTRSRRRRWWWAIA